MLQNAPECFRMLPNASECFQMLQIASQNDMFQRMFHRMLQRMLLDAQNASKNASQNACKCFQLIREVSDRFGRFQNASKCCKMFIECFTECVAECFTGCFQMFRKVSECCKRLRMLVWNCFRMLQNASE